MKIWIFNFRFGRDREPEVTEGIVSQVNQGEEQDDDSGIREDALVIVVKPAENG